MFRERILNVAKQVGKLEDPSERVRTLKFMTSL